MHILCQETVQGEQGRHHQKDDTTMIEYERHDQSNQFSSAPAFYAELFGR